MVGEAERKRPLGVEWRIRRKWIVWVWIKSMWHRKGPIGVRVWRRNVRVFFYTTLGIFVVAEWLSVCEEGHYREYGLFSHLVWFVPIERTLRAHWVGWWSESYIKSIMPPCWDTNLCHPRCLLYRLVAYGVYEGKSGFDFQQRETFFLFPRHKDYYTGTGDLRHG